MTFESDHGAAPSAAPSWWRRSWDRVRSWRPGRGGAGATPSGRRRLWSWTWRIVVVALVLYYPVGALIVENIDDDPQFAPRNAAPGESRAVAAAADLITREVDAKTWAPMMPFFLPAGILDNMPNFQRGMAALGRFGTELMDQVGRVRGTSQVDRDLEQARGFLNEQPNIWIWQPSVSLMPSATSAQKYRAGRDRLTAYNKRLAAGQAVFERRADNLQALIDRIANDEGSDSAVIDQHIIESAGDLFDRRADDIFYFNKGRLYANYILLRELGIDFENVIRERNLTNAWNGTVETFRVASALDPWIVWNGYPDGLLIPNHLAAQGFYLLRARVQLLRFELTPQPPAQLRARVEADTALYAPLVREGRVARFVLRPRFPRSVEPVTENVGASRPP